MEIIIFAGQGYPLWIGSKF